MTTVLRILYIVFVATSILFGLWFIGFNAIEIICILRGQETKLGQMTRLTDKETIWYSIAYLLPYFALTTLGTYFVAKEKKMKAIICYIFIFAIFGIELYTDSLFLIKV